MVAEVAMDIVDRVDGGDVESEEEKDPLVDHHVMVITVVVGLQIEQSEGSKPVHPWRVFHGISTDSAMLGKEEWWGDTFTYGCQGG